MVHAIRVHQPGGPDSLQWDEVLVGAPGPGHVRLRQTAVGLNYIDIYHRTGAYPVADRPFIPGLEGAGVVDAVGPDVTELKVGDRVAYASQPLGAYAEQRLMPAARLVVVPDGISDIVAAGMMLQGMTARYLLRETFSVKPGDWILVHAAAGGVGLLLCQWARHLGATVIGTVSTEEKAALAAANGCTHPIVYTREDFVARTRALTGGAGVAVVYDSVGQTTFTGSLDCLRPRGMMVSFGQASGPIGPTDLSVLAQKGSLFLTRPTLFAYTATPAELRANAAELFQMVLSGAVRVDVRQTFPLREAAAAHRALEGRATTGATVLIP